MLCLLLAVAIAAPGPSRGQSCPIVSLAADFKAGDLKGTAPADGVACYELRFPEGQNMSIELLDSQNVTASVPGHYDSRSDRMFLGNLPGHLEVRVFQLMRSAGEQPFTLRIRFEAPGNG